MNSSDKPKEETFEEMDNAFFQAAKKIIENSTTKNFTLIKNSELASLRDQLSQRDELIEEQAKEIEELKLAMKWKQTQIEDLLNQQKDNSPF